jgi:hypothetical protein
MTSLLLLPKLSLKLNDKNSFKKVIDSSANPLMEAKILNSKRKTVGAAVSPVRLSSPPPNV